MENMSEEDKRLAVGHCSFIFISLYSTTALFCSLSSSGWCDFLERDIILRDPYNITTGCTELGLEQVTCDAFLHDHSVGLYSWQVTVPVNQVFCTSYTQQIPGVGWVDPDFDSKFKAVQVFSMISNFFGLFAWLTIAMASCCPLSQERLKGMSIYFFLASFFQGMTLLLLKSDVCELGFFRDYFLGSDLVEENIDKVIAGVECSLDRGGRLAIVATVFYFLSMNQIPTAIVPPPLGYRRAAVATETAAAADEEAAAPAAEPPASPPAAAANE